MSNHNKPRQEMVHRKLTAQIPFAVVRRELFVADEDRAKYGNPDIVITHELKRLVAELFVECQKHLIIRELKVDEPKAEGGLPVPGTKYQLEIAVGTIPQIVTPRGGTLRDLLQEG